MKKVRRKFISTYKGYGRDGRKVYYALEDCEDINLEPLTIHRIMKKIEVELLNPVEFSGMFGVKHYAKGIHSLDSDLAKLLVRVKSARFIIPHKEVPAAKASKH